MPTACFRISIFLLLLAFSGNCIVAAQSIATTPGENERFFVDKLYPMLRSAQCDLCHNDNGAASATGIEFPDRNATPDQILAFGFQLREFVDRKEPQKSQLLLKPTNREEHTGGVRIVPGSEQEQTMRAWIKYLANLSDAEQLRVSAIIERASQWSLQPLNVRRLTHSQYSNTIRDLLGDQSQPGNIFPKEDFIHGFKNQIEGQNVSPLQAEAYSNAAERLARSAFRGGDSRNLIQVKSSSPSDAEAAASFVRQFGLKAFRRPLSNEETTKYVRLFLAGSTKADDFNAGAQLVAEAMLQSPYFLFRIQRREEQSHDQFEIASQLSYLLWFSTPDEQMLQAASESQYSDVARIEAQARRMLDDPRAAVALDEFLAQWMRFDRTRCHARSAKVSRIQ